MFCDEACEPTVGSTIYRHRFLPLMQLVGLPVFRFHDLRHDPAGSRVNLKIVSSMLGHSSVAIALDVYSHVLPDMLQGGSDEIGDVLFGEETRLPDRSLHNR